MRLNIYQIKIQLYRIFESIFGANNVRKCYLERSIKTYHHRKVIFIHIPKAGGTSVAHALYGKRMGHFYAKEIRDRMGERAFSETYAFTIIRNPYDRLVSAYHFAKQGGSKEGAVKFNKYYQSGLFQNFHSFVTQWLVLQDPVSIEIVFRPQYLFLTDENQQLIVNYLGKLEALDESLHEVEKTTGVPFHIGWKNRSSHLEYRTYYTIELQALVYNYYRQDFELLGYIKDI